MKLVGPGIGESEDIAICFSIGRRASGRWVAFRSEKPLFFVEEDTVVEACEKAQGAIDYHDNYMRERARKKERGE